MNKFPAAYMVHDEINREIDKARAERRLARKADGQKELEDDKDAHHIAFLPPIPPPQPGAAEFVRLLTRKTVEKIDSPIKRAIRQPISGFIFAIALWEAWKLNFAAGLAFNGPFRLSRKNEPGPDLEGATHDV